MNIHGYKIAGVPIKEIPAFLDERSFTMYCQYDPNKCQYFTNTGETVKFLMRRYAIVNGQLYYTDELGNRTFSLTPVEPRHMATDLIERSHFRITASIFSGSFVGGCRFLYDLTNRIVTYYKSDIIIDLKTMVKLRNTRQTCYYPLGFREFGVDSISFIENRDSSEYTLYLWVEIDGDADKMVISICTRNR